MTEWTESIEKKSVKDYDESSRLPQWIAGLTVSFFAMSLGTTQAWTSPAGVDGVKLAGEYNISMTEEQFSWISAALNLGGAAACIPVGIAANFVGTKNITLMLVLPFTVGWVFVIWAKSTEMFYAGRFILGVGGSALSIIEAIYISETAEAKIRGKLGLYPELFASVGILITYILGAFVSMYSLSIVSAIIPLLFFVVFVFMPETPTYYVRNNDIESAKKSLQWFRGPNYNIEQELEQWIRSNEELKREQTSFFVGIKSKADINALIVSFGLMFFEQMSGLSAIIFYAEKIFQETNADLNPDILAVTIGILQIVSVFCSSLVVDRWGRRTLLILSGIAMCLCTFALGTFFYLERRSYDISAIEWLPPLSIIIYIIMIQAGFGPLAWLIPSEIFSLQIKNVACTVSAVFNWICAFLVTKFFGDVEDEFGPDAAFWSFSAICALSVIFVLLLVPETKQKTLEEIRMELKRMGRKKTIEC